MDKETGGAAFPSYEYDTQVGQILAKGGMTLRDYFAAKAMQGICADPSTNPPTAGLIATISYEVADAMLAERAA